MIAALHPGAFYHIEALEGPRYASLFARLIRPEALDEATLSGISALLVPCRTSPARLVPHTALFRSFLARGGTLVAMGETFQDLWLPGLTLTPEPTNWWWWLTPGADLGLRILRPDHPLMRGIAETDASWHLHGWFDTPPGAEVLIADRGGRALLFVDAVNHGAGRLVATTLDPFYHHGSHFMPATTRFLDRFLANLLAWNPP
ncbi:MAG: hypothetical protein NZM27_09725 [Acetobacteraceae bacterium]|nr:hypothetical protein [Acetobacteraceae bacterium]MDW8398802.1 hypothetical protein [Acetobacteraceae bacterium]